MKKITNEILTLRKDYSSSSLNETEVNKNPIHQFELWLQQAIDAEIPEANAMTIATVSLENKPTSRIVLLRGFDDNGFAFFTNYESKKGNDVKQNPNVALHFFWAELERQIRIEGTISKVEEKVSDDYFNSRPRESQIGAWASHQSAVIKNREEVETAFEFYQNKFKDTVVPRPPHWGGYVVKPTAIEFWQGRAGRLHDRLKYVLENNVWKISRLSP